MKNKIFNNQNNKKMLHSIFIKNEQVKFETPEEGYNLLIAAYPWIANKEKAKKHIKDICWAHLSGYRFKTSANLIDGFAIGGNGSPLYIRVNTPSLFEGKEAYTLPVKCSENI